MQNEMTGVEWNSRWSPLAASLFAHCVLITSLVFWPTRENAAIPVDTTIVTPLVYQPVEKPLVMRTLRAPAVKEPKAAPLPPPVEPTIPKPAAKQFQAFLPEQPREQPKAIAIQTPEQVVPAAASLPQAKLATPDFSNNLPTRLAPAMPVKTNVFASSGTSPNGPVPASHLDVHTGGFGGPEGSPVQSGGGKGSGAAVHTGGFGDSNGAGSGGSGSGNGKPAVVASAGFGNATVQNPAPHRAEPAAPSETPVEVLWKPKPVYTDEARAKKLEGSVTLEVIFRATGQVEVLRVRSGLGSGLDQSARSAAEQIRFRPGKKDGVPVDKTGLVLITFELS
jgi:TonB family protein